MKPIQILLVEDNEGDILLTREAFEEAKILNQIHVVRDGEEALKYVSKKPPYESASRPDMILLDINLPKLNGHQVLQLIKQNEDLRHIPTIMLTTSSSDKDVNLSYEHHANCFITKPVEIEKFFEAINIIEDFWLNIVSLPKKS